MALTVDRTSDGDKDTAEIKVDGELIVLVTHHKKSGKVDVALAPTAPEEQALKVEPKPIKKDQFPA